MKREFTTAVWIPGSYSWEYVTLAIRVTPACGRPTGLNRGKRRVRNSMAPGWITGYTETLAGATGRFFLARQL